MDNFSLNLLMIGFVIGILTALVVYFGLVRRIAHRKIEAELQGRKDQFIGLASHYLLNPITIIQSAIASLQEKETELSSAERFTFYDAIERGQQRLWILAEQLVLVGEIDQNDLRLKIAVNNLFDAVSGAITAVDPFARAKRIKISLNYVTKEAQEARFDARRMKQAFIAVLDNAVKFSLEDSQINVILNLESGIFTLQVEDQGIGMADGLISHISEKFSRGAAIYNFDYEGIGLGLHVAQAIVQLHQGRITFVSKPKRGTTATIQWPNL